MSKLKTMRQTKGLSQSQLAEKANMNVRTLQHYEQGSKVFDHARIDTILRVCLALNCKLEDIIENQDYIDLIKRYENS
nr:MAG TPA: helix-turn-helix domain protein [Caudoviricetes sp.]